MLAAFGPVAYIRVWTLATGNTASGVDALALGVTTTVFRLTRICIITVKNGREHCSIRVPQAHIMPGFDAKRVDKSLPLSKILFTDIVPKFTDFASTVSTPAPDRNIRISLFSPASNHINSLSLDVAATPS